MICILPGVVYIFWLGVFKFCDKFASLIVQVSIFSKMELFCIENTNLPFQVRKTIKDHTATRDEWMEKISQICSSRQAFEYEVRIESIDSLKTSLYADRLGEVFFGW